MGYEVSYHDYSVEVKSSEGTFFTTVTSYDIEDVERLAALKLGFDPEKVTTEIIAKKERNRL